MRPCDLCGATDSLDTPGDPSGKIRICSGCGFVHVKERRSVEDVANAWEKIYAEKHYDPNWPGVKARLFYVAEWISQNLGLEGHSILDIGAGNGIFLDFCRQRGGHPVGLDPSPRNAATIRALDIACFQGYASDTSPDIGQYDIVTLNWTLENTADCLEVLRYAKRQLKPDGHVVVATGSRFEGFKKPLTHYIPQDPDYPHDTHCFRWSGFTLHNAFAAAGLCAAYRNDYEDRDELIMVATNAPGKPVDDPPSGEDVREFFAEWLRMCP